MIRRVLKGLDEVAAARVAAEILVELEDGVGRTDGEDSFAAVVRRRAEGVAPYEGDVGDFVLFGRRGDELVPFERRGWDGAADDEGRRVDGFDFRRGGLRKAGIRRFSGLGDVDDLIEESDDGGVLVEAQSVGASRLPERLSEVFSRDSRRYDGAFERY